MPRHVNTRIENRLTAPRSIRDELEQRAWIQNPGLARRLSRRLVSNRSDNTRRPGSRQTHSLLSLGFVLLMLFALRPDTAVADQFPWGLQIKSSVDSYTELALDTDIRINITGLVARVDITQKFSNPGQQWAEGLYRFPLPEGAAVDRMLVKVGDRVLEGEIQERESARRTYQKARDAGRTTTIVEQQRRNQFETRLANIGPGESIEITISYLQNVSYSDLSYHLRLPMTFTPRWEPAQQIAAAPAGNLQFVPAIATNNHKLKLKANLVTAMDFAAIESRYHDVDIRQVDNGYQVELLDPDARTDRDFELSWTPTLQSRPAASLTTFNEGESVYAQLMLAPPLADSIAPQAREVILIIDTSGSMEGASLVQAKAALHEALKSLGPDDYFNLLQFNSSTEALFDQSVPVARNSLYVAQNFINSLNAEGGTNMEPALRTALAMPPIPDLMRQVVFVTDGAVGNEAALLKMIADNLGDSRMFTVAIGYSPNNWFMRKTAEIGRGSYVHIARPDEVEAQMSALWGRIQLPALTDICVDWGDTAEFYPEIIPDLYAGEPLWLIARLPAEPGLINLCGQLNGQHWETTINSWDAANSGPGGDNLAKLWARKKIEALEDSLMFGADSELTQLQITDVALEYGLLTRHTSLVAVDKTPRRVSAESLAQADVPGLLPAGSSNRLAGFPSTATGWLTQLLLSVLVLLLATAMLVLSGSGLPMTKQDLSA